MHPPDRNHRFIYANQVLLQMWNQTWDGAIDKNCLEFDYGAMARIIQSSVRIDLPVTDVALPGGINGRQVADAARSKCSSN